MKVYCYWESIDLDCKKLFHFMEQDDEMSVKKMINRNNELKVDRVWERKYDYSQVERNINDNEVIIFCTHGTPGSILKYRGRSEENETLIDETNLHILDHKIVLSFCCSSAKKLGLKSVSEPYSCYSYVGFDKDIAYDSDDSRAKKSRGIIYRAYKSAFSKAIVYAVDTRCSVGEFRKILYLMLNKESTKAILEAADNSVHNIFAGAIEGVVSHGDQERNIFN